MNPVEEMKLAADLISREDHIGLCAGGFPVILSQDECRFCGATYKEKCRRREQSSATPNES